MKREEKINKKRIPNIKDKAGMKIKKVKRKLREKNNLQNYKKRKKGEVIYFKELIEKENIKKKK